MTILKTLSISGGADPQKIDLPAAGNRDQKIAYVISGNAEEVQILQEDNASGPRLIVPADDGSGFQISPIPLTGGEPPRWILVDTAEPSAILLTIVRIS